MSLEDQLAAIREMAARRIPADKLATMSQATRALRDSGILDRAIRVGDRLPPFVLANTRGVQVNAVDLLARGAVVLTVFRGHW